MKEQCCCSPVSYQKVKLEATQNWQRAVSGPENLKGLLGVKGKSLQLFFSPLLAPTNGNLCKCKERSDSGLSTTFWYPGTKALSRLKMRGEKNPTKLAAVECAVLFWNMDVEGQEYHLLSVYRNADSTPLYLCSQQSWGEVLSPMIQNWTLDRSGSLPKVAELARARSKVLTQIRLIMKALTLARSMTGVMEKAGDLGWTSLGGTLILSSTILPFSPNIYSTKQDLGLATQVFWAWLSSSSIWGDEMVVLTQVWACRDGLHAQPCSDTAKLCAHTLCSPHSGSPVLIWLHREPLIGH